MDSVAYFFETLRAVSTDPDDQLFYDGDRGREFEETFTTILDNDPDGADPEAVLELSNYLRFHPEAWDSRSDKFIFSAVDDLVRINPLFGRDVYTSMDFLEEVPEFDWEDCTGREAAALGYLWSLYYLWPRGLKERLIRDDNPAYPTERLKGPPILNPEPVPNLSIGGGAADWIVLHDKRGQDVLNRIQREGDDFWKGTKSKPCGEEYTCEEIRLKKEGSLFLPYVFGDVSASPDIIAELVQKRQNLLVGVHPQVLAVVLLSTGYDPKVNDAPYADIYQLLDGKVLYFESFQRLYRVERDGIVYVPYEQIHENDRADFGLSDLQWASYQRERDQTKEGLKQKKGFFLRPLGEIEPGRMFGLFTLQPLGDNKTKTSFVSYIEFSGVMKNIFNTVMDLLPGIINEGLMTAFDAYGQVAASLQQAGDDAKQIPSYIVK
ncbi:MAG: hypothetical protein HYU99_11445 [Deltaproteobacteria bacterium]|nr:hypothetical protein [Deltaproteobacteria bacterium]